MPNNAPDDAPDDEAPRIREHLTQEDIVRGKKNARGWLAGCSNYTRNNVSKHELRALEHAFACAITRTRLETLNT